MFDGGDDHIRLDQAGVGTQHVVFVQGAAQGVVVGVIVIGRGRGFIRDEDAEGQVMGLEGCVAGLAAAGKSHALPVGGVGAQVGAGIQLQAGFFHAGLLAGGGAIRADEEHGGIELDLALFQIFRHHVEAKLLPAYPRPKHVAIEGRTSELDGLSMLGVTTVVMRTLVKGICRS